VAKDDGRKAALAAFRERKLRVGIYAIRCLASNERWVGRSADLEAIKKRILFTLTHRSNPHRSLQEAWNSFGAANIVFEEIEVLAEDLSEMAQELWLKKKLQEWVAGLQAKRI
jgi:hypothetical protein